MGGDDGDDDGGELGKQHGAGPVGVAVGPEGELYVVDCSAGRML